MIESIIAWSIRNRVFVLLLAVMLTLGGMWTLDETPIDAIPDLSDTQVIVKTTYAGQAPQVVEQQVTYPLTSALMAVPKATDVRGFSFFGDSYIYVLFEDETDLYWARSRVQEVLAQTAGMLPSGASTTLGPDATGVGWVYMYALVDTSGTHDLAQLRSLQDWYLKYELQGIEGVSEVASMGGMVRQYQVEIDPVALAAFDLSITDIARAIERGNAEQSASVVEIAEAEYMVRLTGYIEDLADLESLLVVTRPDGSPITVSDVARVSFGPAMRRGVADLNGQGEVAGGIVVMRSGENARATIERVKAKLAALKPGLGKGVDIVTVYDRSKLIDRSIDNLVEKLAQELLVVALVCMLFLMHLRTSVVALISLPLGILGAFIIMRVQGLNANIMSLGGIAIAIGAMSDGAIVMTENFHKHLRRKTAAEDHWQIVVKSAAEVGPALFFSLLIITVSFLPVFALQAEEGKLFSPLAYTKTWSMAISAGLAITLIPVLMGFLIKSDDLPRENTWFKANIEPIYARSLGVCLSKPWITLAVGLLAIASMALPLRQLTSEFMPPLDEGDLMYMPTTYPGISIAEARKLLQRTNQLIAGVPEVQRVFGKVGRADTATDPAPLTMIETFITLKPQDEWREGVTSASIKQELNARVQFPGVSNAWVMPIKTRIDMLSTGVKTPLALKISGADLSVIESLAIDIERIIAGLDDASSVYAERPGEGRYLVVDIDRQRAANAGMTVADIQAAVSYGVGGQKVSDAINGLERYPINVRYPQAWRDSAVAIADMPLRTPQGAYVALSEVADVSIDTGPAVIKSDNAKPASWVLIDIESEKVADFIRRAKHALSEQLDMPSGYSLAWQGSYESAQRAQARFMYVVPVTIAIIVALLYLNFRRWMPVAVTLCALPLALSGAVWLIWLLDYAVSVAVAVGVIALAGLATEMAVLMLVYLQQVPPDNNQVDASDTNDTNDSHESSFDNAMIQAAASRLRPVLMTSSTVILGLLPVMWGSGAGSDVMQRIAAPMIGGMVSALLLALFIIPVLYRQLRR